VIDLISSCRHVRPVLTVLCAAVLTASCARGNATAEKPPESAGTGGNAIDVSTAVAQGREVPVAVEVPGSFMADESSDVATDGSGVVAATPANVGDRVSRGTILARLDERDARLRLDQARAAVQQAEAALGQARERHRLAETTAARYAGLMKTGDVSRTVYDQLTSEAETTRQAISTAEAALVDAKSRVALAEKAVADTTIRAPFDGFVTARTVTVGEYVAPGTKVATVMRLHPIKLRMQVPEVVAGQIRRGQTVTARVDALGGSVVTGRVTAVNAALDPATRAVMVEATAPNPEGTVRAEMFATARIELGKTEPGVFIPKSALLPDPNTNSYQAFVIEGDIARLRVLQIGGEDQQQVRVQSGIKAGETVATSALEQLFDGARVAVASTSSSAPSR
jgi:RND family efflux transporter MFP subunit